MKITVKKITALVLALMFALSCAVTAFAFSSCEKCERIFENESDFATHAKICGVGASTEAITFYCGYCSAVYQTKALLSAHIEKCALKPATAVKGNSNSCPYCLEEIDVEAEYNNHIQLCKETFPCSNCGLEFKTKAAVNLHFVPCRINPYEIKAEVSIKNKPEAAEVKYGDILVLTAETKNMPAGGYVKWAIDGSGATIEQSELGETCSVTVTGSGTVTVIARAVDENGKPLKTADGKEIYDSEVVECKGGFIYKIISFFKDLFKSDRKIIQVIY